MTTYWRFGSRWYSISRDLCWTRQNWFLALGTRRANRITGRTMSKHFVMPLTL